MSEWPSEGLARSREPQLKPESRATILSRGSSGVSTDWKWRSCPQCSQGHGVPTFPPQQSSHVGLDQSLYSCQVS